MSDLSVSGSIEEFHFSGPAEELDFTEPADFTFPEQPAASDQSGELSADHGFMVPEPVGAESFLGAEGFGPEQGATAESPLAEDAGVEPQLAGEGIADLESGEEAAKPKPKFQAPAWVRTAEWVMVGLLGVGEIRRHSWSPCFGSRTPSKSHLR